MLVVAGKGHRCLVTSFDFFLSFEWPELDHNRADEDVVSDRIIGQRTENILRSVGHTVNDRLDALVMTRVPDLDNLVCAQTDQMVALLIDIQMAY